MLKKFVNSFTGGLNKDISPTKYSNTHYFDLENFRVITDTDDGLSSGSLVNVKGNAAAFTIPNSGTVLGWQVFRDNLILITTASVTDPDRIYKLPLNELTSAQNITLTDTYYFNGTYSVYDDAGTNKCDGLIYKGDLNLSTSYPINDIVVNYESSSIQKIYWVDGYNPLYHLNIVNDSDTNPLETLDIDRLKILPQHNYGTMALTLSTGGILKSGKVQYAYQLYSVNGTETMFSPASGLFDLTAAEYPTSETTSFYGSDLEDYTNKAVNVTIGLESDYTDFNRIRLVALDYQEYGNVPMVRIVEERAISSATINITDYGYSVGGLTLEEFQLLRNNLTPMTLEVKNNYLLAGNITESWFDVDQLYLDTKAVGDHPFLDTRAYRWRYYDPGGTAPIELDATVNKNEINEVVIDAGIGPDFTAVSETHDAYNTYNNIENDISTDHQYKYKQISSAPSTSDLGGTGPFISYSFGAEAFDMGTSYLQDEFPLWKPDTNSDAYDNPEETYLRIGYARDEVYRFAVTFIDLQGRTSYAKWIGDIRMPNWNESNYMSSAGNGNILYVKFTIDWDSLPTSFKSQISGIRFVRSNRTEFDKTIKGMGIITPIFKHTGTTKYYSSPYITDCNAYNTDTPPGYPLGSDAADLKQDILDFISPELVFNKNMQTSTDSFVEVIGNVVRSSIGTVGSGGANIGYKRSVRDNSSNINATFLYDNINPISLSTGNRSGLRRDSNEWILTTPEYKEPPAHTIAGTTYYNRSSDFLNSDAYRGFTGTKMVINIDSVFNTAYTPTTSNVGEGMLALYRRPLGESLYGGNTYYARSTSSYIPASQFILKDASGAQTENVYGGDTFINMFPYLYSFVDETEAGGSNLSVQNLIFFPVESSININYRTDQILKYFTTCDNVDPLNPVAPEYYLSEFESIGISQQPTTYPENVGNLYRYNKAYSAYDMSHQYLPKPFDFNDEEVKDTLVIASERKFPNEYSDSWLIFKYNNYQLLDGNHGAITRILHKDNKLLCFQPSAISILSMMEREVVQSQNTANLAVGTGGILSRYDYLTTSSGTSIHKGIIATDLGLYYVDDYNRSIRQFGESLEPITETKGLKSYFSETTITDAITAYDSANREVLFYITDSEGNMTSSVICFNGFTNTFTGFYTYIPDQFIWFRKSLLSSSDNNSFYRHGDGNYGVYYGDSPDSSTITLIINPAQSNVVRFDILEWISLVLNADTEQLTTTFDKMRVSNSYQDTGWITLTSGTNITKRLRKWRMNSFRDNVANSGRIRDAYIKVELEYYNTNNYKFMLNDIITNWFPTKIR